MFDYVILLYLEGTVTTVIGYADMESTMSAFREACAKNNASWAYLYRGDGTELARFGV